MIDEAKMNKISRYVEEETRRLTSPVIKEYMLYGKERAHALVTAMACDESYKAIMRKFIDSQPDPIPCHLSFSVKDGEVHALFEGIIDR